MLASKCRTRWHGWRRPRRQWREGRTGWQLACQSGGRTASTSCICVGDRESCLVSLSTPTDSYHVCECDMLDLICSQAFSLLYYTCKAISKARLQGVSCPSHSAQSIESLKPNSPYRPRVCVCSISQVGRLIVNAKCSAAVRLFCSRPPFTYITYYAKNGMQVSLWRSDVCHMSLHVISCIHRHAHTSIVPSCTHPSIHPLLLCRKTLGPGFNEQTWKSPLLEMDATVAKCRTQHLISPKSGTRRCACCAE
jgi:hypothetical protein